MARYVRIARSRSLAEAAVAANGDAKFDHFDADALLNKLDTTCDGNASLLDGQGELDRLRARNLV